MAAVDAQRKRGPKAGATRGEVVLHARAEFLACRRVDMRAIATDRGVARGTLYRWFGSRERLLGEAMLGVTEQRMADARATVDGEGAAALLDTLDQVFRGLVAAPHVRALIERERETALTVITSSSGAVHPRMVELVEGMIKREVERGYEPPSDPHTLAYVLVRLTEGLLFNFAEDDLEHDLDKLRTAFGSLLGA